MPSHAFWALFRGFLRMHLLPPSPFFGCDGYFQSCIVCPYFVDAAGVRRFFEIKKVIFTLKIRHCSFLDIEIDVDDGILAQPVDASREIEGRGDDIDAFGVCINS